MKPYHQINISNCLIIDSKKDIKEVPSNYQIYYIIAKRKVYVYFREHSNLLQTMKIFNDRNIQYYRRESSLPDREQYEEQTLHSYYKIKKMDQRKNLQNISFEQLKSVEKKEKIQEKKPQPEQKMEVEEKKYIEIVPQEIIKIQEKIMESQSKIIGNVKFNNPEIKSLLENKELMRKVCLLYRT